ncbi:MAG: GNAT family N-acetyltransferase [Gemmatimonadaceae bacterium]
MRALEDSPDAFGSTFARETTFSNQEWSTRLSNGVTSPLNFPSVAECDGRAVGLMWTRVEPEDRSLAMLYQVWVDPEYRRHGVGRALLDAAVSWARSAGVTTIALSVANGPRSALEFYKSAGFVVSGEPLPLRAGSDIVQRGMELRLKEP